MTSHLNSVATREEEFLYERQTSVEQDAIAKEGNRFKWQNVKSWLLNFELKDALFLSTETENVSFLCKCTSVDEENAFYLSSNMYKEELCLSMRFFNEICRLI